MSSNANKSEAYNAYEKAKKRAQEGNIEGAIKMLQKSIRMYEIAEAKALLAQLQNTSNRANASTSSMKSGV